VSIAEELAGLREEIAAACQEAGRTPQELTLIAVTKTHPPEAIREAWACGLRAVGENRVQELLRKKPLLADCPLEWHLVGHLQTNKAKLVVPEIALLHSLDRIELAQVIERVATEPVDALIQVNVTGEGTKAGVEPDRLPGLIDAVRAGPKIRLRGLMTIGPYDGTVEENRRAFARLRTLRAEASRNHPDLVLEILSMGMSGDFREAILEGATHLRIGSRLFGERPATTR
jgi:pyridoxal phosphate enzyme (YggS family)